MESRSQQSVPSNRLMTLTVQCPTIQTHVYWCVSVPRLGREPEFVLSPPSVPHASVLRGVVICVHFVSALQTTEVFSVAVVLVCEPVVRSRTALGRVVRLDLLHRDTLLGRSVLDVLEQALERPNVVPFRLRESLTDVG